MRHASDEGRSPGALPSFEAVLFDLDGVLTPTADVHARAWAGLFQPFLAARAAERPYTEDDYFDHIDGKPRYEGVDALLRSRGIELSWGDPSDAPDATTVCGLGNRKDELFRQLLEDEGVEPYPGSLKFLDRIESLGIGVAVVSSSRNARSVLAAAGLTERFEVVVDGLTAAAEGLPGKPDPATYARAAELLGVPVSGAIVVEDALSGVAAGRAGGFALVVGVDRGAGARALSQHGADVVVADLAELVASLPEPLLDRRRFPIDQWRLLERQRPAAEQRGHAETLFALGNGYLGLRGNQEEGGPAYEHGSFINGFHETWPIVYPEGAYGFAEVGQTILNLPDAKTVELEVNGDRFDPDSGDVEEYERCLDMAAGVLERRLVWRTASGARVAVASRRLVSFVDRHLAVVAYSVTALDGDVEVTLRSPLIDRQAPSAASAHGDAQDAAEPAFDPRRSEDMSGALEPRRHGADGSALTSQLAHATRGSRLGVAVKAKHRLHGAVDIRTRAFASPPRAEVELTFRLERGASATLEKYVAYHDGGAEELEELLAACDGTLAEAAALGVDGVLAQQRAWLDAFWADADVQVPGQPAVQQALRWNLYALLQSAARADGRGISAKGVSGSGYSGHYFWDTEIYVLPYLIHTLPQAARSALAFRHALLPAARRRAQTMDEAGALFPWRTINGEEASAYYPAGTAQYHINADVAYAVAKYAAVTGDAGFMSAHGAEIAVETARLWLSLGFFKPSTGAFHINAVTGPDEYSAVVDDNLYTNLMAAYNLRFAATALTELRERSEDDYQRLAQSVGLGDDEPAAWLAAADAIFVPYDEGLGIHLQDARWLEREPWDIAGTPPNRRPLLLHYHPLVIYRHQVLKQADLVLALYLHASRFSQAEKKANFDYYDPLTTGDSSLSAAVQSIIAAEVGYPELALSHFDSMLYVDLADLHGNAADGVHVASTGGTWQALVSGFGGMREDGGRLRFDPRLPASWRSLGFTVRSGGAKVRVLIEPHRAKFALASGDGAVLEVRGRELRLAGPEPVSVEL